MRSFFSELLEYNRQMNRQIILYMVQHKDRVSEKSVKWMNHILNAQGIYNSRLEPVNKSYRSWDVRPLEELESLNEELHRITSEVASWAEFDMMIHYTTATGLSMQHTLSDVLFHIVNHATYHRGQIATDFRNTGLEPLVTDYVVWKRYK